MAERPTAAVKPADWLSLYSGGVKRPALMSELRNGTQLLAVQLPHARRQVLYAQLVIGSRFEAPEVSGLSHFLEHMLFRGVPSHPSSHALALAFERWGGTLAASTAADLGDLSVGVPAANFEHILAPFVEVFTSPLMRDIEVERGIVREEILETLDETGACVDAAELMRALVFAEHPLGLPIAGTVSHLERFDEALLQAHHRQFYVGAGTTVVSAGPLPPERVLRLFESAFAGVAAGEQPDTSPPPAQTQRRMQFAATLLLLDSERSLAEVAEQVGYQSEFAFSRAFKRHHGVAPGEYRRTVATVYRRSAPVMGLASLRCAA